MQKKKPVIALVDIGQDSELRKEFRQQYIDRLHEAGAEVRMIPQEAENIQGKTAARLSGCDGLLLPGGGDIDPVCWNGVREPWCGEPSPVRDILEASLLNEAREKNLPVFGICRGIQSINVFSGGSLYQDVNRENATDALWHSDTQRRRERVHQVMLQPESWLGRTLNASRIGVNSMHHQAVRRTAPGFSVTAVSEDGLVEGIEYQGSWFCVGVQWHPEHLALTCSEQRFLFSGFLEVCEKRK